MTTNCECPNQFSCGAKLQGSAQVQRDPSIEADAEILLSPLPYQFDVERQAFNPYRYEPPKPATTSPFLQHASLDALTEKALQHPSGTAGISDVKEYAAKTIRAFQLTADHYIDDADTVAKAGTWAVALLTAQNGKPIWFYMDDVDFRNSFSEPTPSSATLMNALLGICQTLFPGASIAQMEDAVYRGGYIAMSAEQRATKDGALERAQTACRVLAQELECVRPIVKMVKKVRSAAVFHDRYVNEVQFLLDKAAEHGY